MKNSILTRVLSFIIIYLLVFNTALAVEFNPKDEKEAYALALEYLKDVCFGSEYGKADDTLKIFKNDILINMQGEYTADDMEFAENFINELNSRVAYMPKISFVSNKRRANIVVTYAPLKSLGKLSKQYVSGNWGYFTYFYNAKSEITSVEILIASDVSIQRERNHLFMEELVGSLGLAKDSHTYKDSILYAEWTTTQELSDIDWLCLNMIYNKGIKAGMSYKQVRKILEKNMN